MERKSWIIWGSFIIVLLALLGATYGFYLPLRISLQEVESQASGLNKLLRTYCESLLEARKEGYIRGKRVEC